MSTSITLELPETLAEQTRAEGFFEPETLTNLLEKALRQNKRTRLFSTGRQHQRSGPQLIPSARIKAEIAMAGQASRGRG